MAKDYVSLWTACLWGVFVKTLIWRKVVSSLVLPQRKREGHKISAVISNWSCFKLITFTADKRWQLPLWFPLFSSSFPKSAHPSTTASLIFFFFSIFKVYSNLKTWGRTCTMCPMTDFYRKVNKFLQKIAMCHPKKQIKPNLWHPVILIFCGIYFTART